MDEALRAALRLHHAPGVGPVTARYLIERFGDAEAVCRAGRRALAAAGLSPAAVAALTGAEDPPEVQAARDWATRPGRHLLAWHDPLYPARLRALPDPPLVLYVAGRPEVLTDPQLAVVGSRHATAGGLENAREFARHFARSGLAITSGLALGVDAAAHLGALDVGGVTVAVLATGLDRIYPAQHRDLARRIVEHGALISEAPLGAPPRREAFPRRNRLISGLALGVLVVEAARHSGSLITARLAMEQGREVFALPGSIHNPLAKGCHRLIREGAKLVDEAADVIHELAPQLAAALAEATAGDAPPAAAAGAAAPEDEPVLAALGHDRLTADELVARSGLPAREVLAALSLLELDGRVRVDADGRYQRVNVRDR